MTRSRKLFYFPIIMFAEIQYLPTVHAAGPVLRLERVVVDNDFPDGYQVEIADVNGDGKPDIIGLGGSTCAWFENPGWTKRIVTTGKQSPGIISSATADLDGDGKAEVLIAHDFGLDKPQSGKLILARQGKTPDQPWTTRFVADIGSIHRLRFADVDGDGRLDLVVAPIVGASAKGPAYDQGPAMLLVFHPSKDLDDDPAHWPRETIGGDHVLHGIRVLDIDGDGRAEVLSAGNHGVTLFDRDADQPRWHPQPLVSGAPGNAPKRGSSEVQIGKFKDGRRFLATIDPWHGEDVAVYLAEGSGRKTGTTLAFGPRQVLDRTLKDGHALWVADIDGDGDDEVLAGYRGPGTSILGFDYDHTKKAWTRTVIDAAIAAQDMRGADLDGDGRTDIVAIGGRTHNVVIYRPSQAK